MDEGDSLEILCTQFAFGQDAALRAIHYCTQLSDLLECGGLVTGSWALESCIFISVKLFANLTKKIFYIRIDVFWNKRLIILMI